MNHRLWLEDSSANDAETDTKHVKETHEMGLILQLQAENGRPTQLRIVLPMDQWPSLLQALQLLSANANVDEIGRISITGPMQLHLQLQQKSPLSTKPAYGSIMRHTVAYAMDDVHSRTRTERIVARRGVFHWLPVAYSNDLVHGAWWYVLASLVLTVASAMVLINAYHRRYLGEDDSTLDTFRYRAAWVAMTISGFLFTLGSFAFVRATHDDPPLPPLFAGPRWHHLQSDELLGAWLFFWGTVPVVPYTLLYLAQSHGATTYWVFLAIGCLVVYTMGLFVHACYPSDKEPTPWIQPLAQLLCRLCCSRAFVAKHLANDWLAGNWLMLWTMAALSMVCGVFFLVAVVANDNNVACFQALATFLSMAGYTVGSLYWTAASYPPPEPLSPPLEAPSKATVDNAIVGAVPPPKTVHTGGTDAENRGIDDNNNNNNNNNNNAFAVATVTTV
eukprot:gene10019-7161_t